MLEYPPCRCCGKNHGMGLEDMETGEIKPLDICRDCLFPPILFNPQIQLEDLNED